MLQAENLKVMRSWLVANKGLPNGTPFSRDRFVNFLTSVEQQILKLSDKELEATAESTGDRDRSQRLLTWRWTRRTISLRDFGPWRTVGDALPLEACGDSAVEAAAFISRFSELATPGTDPDAQEKYKRAVARIRDLEQVADVILSRPLLAVLVAEAEQRGRKDCRQLRFSSEDGSHRAIAVALAGHDSIGAWVGNPG
jgi:hypothetical protein